MHKKIIRKKKKKNYLGACIMDFFSNLNDGKYILELRFNDIIFNNNSAFLFKRICIKRSFEKRKKKITPILELDLPGFALFIRIRIHTFRRDRIRIHTFLKDRIKIHNTGAVHSSDGSSFWVVNVASKSLQMIYISILYSLY